FRTSATISFTPDAVASGHATVGYHKMNPSFHDAAAGGAVAFSGLTASVDVGYTLVGVTRVGVHLQRDTSYSASRTAPYFLSTSGGFDITQLLPGPFTLLLRATREQLAYPTTTLAAAHTDFANVYGGGLQVAVSNQARISLNYDYANRR